MAFHLDIVLADMSHSSCPISEASSEIATGPSVGQQSTVMAAARGRDASKLA